LFILFALEPFLVTAGEKCCPGCARVFGKLHSKLELLQDKIFFPNIANIHDKKETKETPKKDSKAESKAQQTDEKAQSDTMELPEIITVKISSAELKQKEDDKESQSTNSKSFSDSE